MKKPAEKPIVVKCKGGVMEKKKSVDKTKRSNRKCEHCTCFTPHGFPVEKAQFGTCHQVVKAPGGDLHLRQTKNYWNCCENFAWKEDL